MTYKCKLSVESDYWFDIKVIEDEVSKKMKWNNLESGEGRAQWAMTDNLQIRISKQITNKLTLKT